MTNDFFKGIVSVIILLSILLILFSDSKASDINKISDLALQKALSFSKVRELKNDNRGKEIDEWHRYHGLGYGNPYCQMFVNYSYKLAFDEINKKYPLLKTPRCATFAKWCIANPLIVKSISIKQLRMGYKLEPGDILNWKHGFGSTPGNFSYNGHAGMVQYQMKNGGLLTIEGNTKPSNKGDQTGRTVGDMTAGNDGVYPRERTFGGGNFQILFAFRLQNNKI